MPPRLLQLHPSAYQRLVRLSKEAERDGAYRVAKRSRAVALNSEGHTSGALEHFHSCYRVPKRVLNHASAFPGESCGNNSDMASSSASLVRAWTERSSSLSFDQAFSMGFRSGE